MRQLLCATILVLAFAVSANADSILTHDLSAFLSISDAEHNGPLPWVDGGLVEGGTLTVNHLTFTDISTPEGPYTSTEMHCEPYVYSPFDGPELMIRFGRAVLEVTPDNPLAAFGFILTEWEQNYGYNEDLYWTVYAYENAELMGTFVFDAPTTDWTSVFTGVVFDGFLADRIVIEETLGSGDSEGFHDFYAEAVPIPSAVWLLGSGLVGLVGFRRKFRK